MRAPFPAVADLPKAFAAMIAPAQKITDFFGINCTKELRGTIGSENGLRTYRLICSFYQLQRRRLFFSPKLGEFRRFLRPAPLRQPPEGN